MSKKFKWLSLISLIVLSVSFGIVGCKGKGSSSSGGGGGGTSCNQNQIDIVSKIPGSLTNLTWKVTTTCAGPLNGIVCFEGGNTSLCSANILNTPTLTSKQVTSLTSSFAVDFLLPSGAEKANFLYCASGATLSIITPHTCNDGSAPQTKMVGQLGTPLVGSTPTPTPTPAPAFDGIYDVTVTTVTPIGTTVLQGTITVTNGIVSEGGTLTGTVDANGNFTGTSVICTGCQPMAMNGTFSSGGNVSITSGSGTTSQTIVGQKR